MPWLRQLHALQWVALFLGVAIPMLALLAYTIRNLGLDPSQIFWLAAATVALAAVSTWIITRV